MMNAVVVGNVEIEMTDEEYKRNFIDMFEDMVMYYNEYRDKHIDSVRDKLRILKDAQDTLNIEDMFNDDDIYRYDFMSMIIRSLTKELL